PIRITREKVGAPEKLLKQIRRTVLDALKHGEYPIEDLSEHFFKQRGSSRGGHFRVVIDLQNMQAHNLQIQNASADASVAREASTAFDLTVSCREGADASLALTMVCDTSLYEGRALEAFGDSL